MIKEWGLKMPKKASYEYYKEKIYSPQYQYYNNNPLQKSTGDCVIRAIAAGLHADWEDVYWTKRS